MASPYEQSPEYQAARCRVRQLRGFYSHLIVYLAVNAGLLVINLLSSPGRLWVVWPLAGWGVALVIHGASVFLDVRRRWLKWEERKLHELIERERSRP